MTIIACTLTAQYPASVKVMTYNINAEKHASGSYNDIAEVITALAPTVCGLQKVDSCNSRNSSDVLSWLGNQTSLLPSFAPAIKKYENSTGSYGIGFLTKETPLSVRRLWIEHTASEQDRAVLDIKTTLGGEQVHFIVTHLAHEGTSYRTAQIKTIIPWIDSIGTNTPMIIMGDFNAAPTENSMKQFETAGFAYVKEKGGKILDTSASQGINHILYRPAARWRCNNAGNPAYAASNRNPVWAEMELLDPVSNLSAADIPKMRVIQDQIALYPSQIQFSTALPALAGITIFDASGSVIKKIVLNGHSGKCIRWHDRPLKGGLYIVRLCTRTTSLRKTAVIIH